MTKTATYDSSDINTTAPQKPEEKAAEPQFSALLDPVIFIALGLPTTKQAGGFGYNFILAILDKQIEWETSLKQIQEETSPEEKPYDDDFAAKNIDYQAGRSKENSLWNPTHLKHKLTTSQGSFAKQGTERPATIIRFFAADLQKLNPLEMECLNLALPDDDKKYNEDQLKEKFEHVVTPIRALALATFNFLRTSYFEFSDKGVKETKIHLLPELAAIVRTYIEGEPPEQRHLPKNKL